MFPEIIMPASGSGGVYYSSVTLVKLKSTKLVDLDCCITPILILISPKRFNGEKAYPKMDNNPRGKVEPE